MTASATAHRARLVIVTSSLLDAMRAESAVGGVRLSSRRAGVHPCDFAGREVAPIAVQGPARCQECFEDRNYLHDTRIRRAAGFYLLSSSSSRMSTASPTLSHHRPSLTTEQHAESWA